MDADELQQIMRQLQELDHRTFWNPTTEKTALIAHIVELSKVTIRVCANEDQGAEDPEEAQAIIKVVGMDRVLDSTLTDAYKVSQELQRILELANVGTKRNRYPVIEKESG